MTIKLTVVMTHPVQYFAPWFRYIAAECPEIELTVLYATQPTAEQQGVGFGQAFTWDGALTEGYRCQVIRQPRADDNVHSDHFWGINVPEMNAALRESQPDVVLLNGWHSVMQLRALWTCRQMNVPVLYRGDTNLNNAPSGWRKLAWQAKTGFLLRQFAAYLAVGQRAAAYLRAFGAPAARLFAVPHCVDNAFFAEAAAVHQTPVGRITARTAWGLAEHDFVVLFAGKLETKKRPLDVIQALAGLTATAQDAVSPPLPQKTKDIQKGCLLVAGTGPLETVCRTEAERLQVRTNWRGFLNQTQITKAFAIADCLVLPSDYGETWGLVVNEALATGLPCIVSDRVGCAPDLIQPGGTGEIFPMGNVAALQAALGRVWQRISAGHQYNVACRAKADEHSFAVATKGLLAACRAVC